MHDSKNLLCKFLICCFILGFVLSCIRKDQKSAETAGTTENFQSLKLKPYRVLVIIGDQWADPLSYNIDPARVKGTEFLDVINMLKIWGVPFDILRLDEQRLQINRFLDGLARPNYGCVIWMANPDILGGYSADYQTLKRVVEEYGMSMIALFDNIKTKDIADLVGVDYTGIKEVKSRDMRDKFIISGNHFITSEIQEVSLPDPDQSARVSIPQANGITPETPLLEDGESAVNIVQCSVSKDSVKVIGTVDGIPQLTVRDVTEDTKVVWIGGGRDWFRRFHVLRTIFRKALVYAIGYGLFNDNFENGLIFIMDDIGCSEHAWSLRWHYPTPRKDTLIKYLIEPLEKYGVTMVMNVTPGFADPEKKIIVSPWTVEPFEDIFGNWQDYGSTKEGLDVGLRRCVFEIQAHRAWSHMNWDLDSPPGPWWGSPVDGELAVTDWYNEVVDVRRDHKPVPSNDLLFIYKTGIDAIKKSFGVAPLAAEVRPGSEILEGTPGGYDNGRVAAIAGLGISRECYVGIDYSIEFSMMMPEQFTCHDLDLTAQTDYPADETETGWDKLLSMSTEQLMSSKIAGGRRVNLHDNLDWIESRKNRRWMGFNETCAYLHSVISVTEANDIQIFYDSHYSKYFETKPSSWTLELSDRYLKLMGNRFYIMADGEKLVDNPGSEQVIPIQAGLGVHKIEIKD